MAWFKVFVSGENFPGDLIGQKSLVGFYTTRFIEADNVEDAETKLLENMRKEKKLSIADKNDLKAEIFLKCFMKLKKKPYLQHKKDSFGM